MGLEEFNFLKHSCSTLLRRGFLGFSVGFLVGWLTGRFELGFSVGFLVG